MTQWENEHLISHMCTNGTIFSSAHKDLRSGVKVESAYETSFGRKCADFVEFGAWHAMFIHPDLNGFAGYDAISYIWQEEQEEKMKKYK